MGDGPPAKVSRSECSERLKKAPAGKGEDAGEHTLFLRTRAARAAVRVSPARKNKRGLRAMIGRS